MRITGLIWLEEIVDKLFQKHSVRESEVVELFNSKPHFRFVEKGHRKGEDVYSALGRTLAGRYLTVFFVLKVDGRALIVSARDMTAGERRRYERQK